jgi:KDO2-lipid IV(A) lauroyltransferase
VAEENVRLALGEACPPPERRAIARASFANLGAVAAELILAPRLLAPRSAAGRFRYDGDWDTLEADLAAGRGALIVTGHLGNWEASNWALRHRGIQLRAVVRTLDDPLLDSLVTRLRGGEGVLIRKWGAARGVLRAVRRGHCVGLLGDQNAGKHGVFVPFFGVDACTFPLPGSLHARFGVPLYAGCALRQGAGFRVSLKRLVSPEGISPAEAETWALKAIHQALEDWIRVYPKQYNWGHRRWRTRPAGEAPGDHLPFYGRPWGQGAAWGP